MKYTNKKEELIKSLIKSIPYFVLLITIVIAAIFGIKSLGLTGVNVESIFRTGDKSISNNDNQASYSQTEEIDNGKIQSTPMDEAYVEFYDERIKKVVCEKMTKSELTIADCESFTMLDLSNLELNNIRDLVKFKNVKHLDISNNYITHIEELKYLKNLNNLNISNNKIENLSPISKVSSLSYFNASTNIISDLSPLTNLVIESQGSLDLSNNQIFDISSLKYLADTSHFANLNLSNNYITDMSSITNLKVGTFDISHNKLTQLKALNRISEIQCDPHYNFSNNNITDVSELNNYEDANINLSYNNISDISSLSDVYIFYGLNLRNNNLSDISPLKDIVFMYNLDIRDNPIVNYDALSRIDIRSLDIDKNIASIVKINNSYYSYEPFNNDPYNQLILSSSTVVDRKLFKLTLNLESKKDINNYHLIFSLPSGTGISIDSANTINLDVSLGHYNLEIYNNKEYNMKHIKTVELFVKNNDSFIIAIE